MDTSYLRLRPKDNSDAMWFVEDVADYIPEQIEETGVDSDPENDPTVKELCIPTRNLNVRFSPIRRLFRFLTINTARRRRVFSRARQHRRLAFYASSSPS